VDLVGRRDECRALEDVVRAVHSGHSHVLVLAGEAGIGKTALLDTAAGLADCQVLRIVGVESDMEFAFAAIHQLSAALADDVGHIPAPQRDALLTAFGEIAGPTPDPFVVGLAILSLLSEASPLVLLVDDQQWLDRASARLLAFVARRLAAEAVTMVFATRSVGDELRGLPLLTIGGLPDDDACALLAWAVDGPVDPRVRDQIVAEARGNPLALLELPRTLSPGELAGGFGWPTASVPHSLEGTFRRQLEGLPLPTRRLLALAAADPAGDPTVMWGAADILGVDAAAAAPAIDAGLAEIGVRVRFRHPLVRASAYRSVPLSDRQRMHAALAAVMDPVTDRDRRAWHLGHATVGPDDLVADELERAAALVQARGGITAAAAFLERSAELTIDRRLRCDRALAAASAKAQAGALDAARTLLGAAEAAAQTELQRARADLVRAQLAFISRHGNEAAPPLLNAARQLETIDARLARETYLDAMSAALFAGRLAGDCGLLEVSRAALAATRVMSAPTPADLLLDGLATQYSVGFEKGLPAVRAALSSWGVDTDVEEEVRWTLLACLAASRAWDVDRHAQLGHRYVHLVRTLGTVTQLPLALSCEIAPLLFTGQFGEAARLVEEMNGVLDALGQRLSPYPAIALAGMRGDASVLARISDTARVDATHRGEGHGLTVIAWAEAVTANARCDYRTARDAATEASSCGAEGGASWWALPELVEATARLRDPRAALEALEGLRETTSASGTDWALGLEARCRALVADGDNAEACHLEAITRLDRGGLRPDLARAHLLYGEWLRRTRRRVDARVHLHAAHALFAAIGMSAFAERARHELTATGAKVRRRSAPTAAGALTPQEAQIARLARDGLSNPEIGARLFISARTVQYHLAKVFTKLGIRSRSQLETALPDQ